VHAHGCQAWDVECAGVELCEPWIAGAGGQRKRADVLRGQSPDLLAQPGVVHRFERRNLSHAGFGDLVSDVVGGGGEPVQEYLCAPVHSLTITQSGRRSGPVPPARRPAVQPYNEPGANTVASNVSHRPPRQHNRYSEGGGKHWSNIDRLAIMQQLGAIPR
jgi:hypothetical protein